MATNKVADTIVQETKVLETTKRSWADSSENDESLTEPTETDFDKDGIKTVIEIKKNEDGKTVKIIKKIRKAKKTYKVNKKVQERREWIKFGVSEGKPSGIEAGITGVDNEINLELTVAATKKKSDEQTDNPLRTMQIICRICGRVGDHWTSRCPYKDQAEVTVSVNAPPKPSLAHLLGRSTAPSSNGEPAKLKYIPPIRRPQQQQHTYAERPGDDSGRKEEFAIRVTNLSEDTKEQDLKELFRQFGPVTRVYLAKDKWTQSSRGFAFINFVYQDDAQKAIDKIDGYGYDNLILHVEWAKPSSRM